jgi:hypothetical protein
MDVPPGAVLHGICRDPDVLKADLRLPVELGESQAQLRGAFVGVVPHHAQLVRWVPANHRAGRRLPVIHGKHECALRRCSRASSLRFQ